ncbi:endonuclease/exonuclease/phosphatase family protein [Halobaculum roseum]|uniref:Endonuclease/exonuclease/phosphatase family protein n=1 Tax=Halobaculum roseum TaxID=2175149 RepID=A0ABD5MRK3_9EURY|nr:endonuclease/exonuclease/phosphatase family protein [Halobaculum roseum]QZY04580.1 endonuclease/exonuclease/phosphatase family protein [Halobaculum roseum]
MGRAATPSEGTATVLTQNVYLGLDFSRLLGARSYRELRRTVGRFLSEVEAAEYRARADAVSAAVEATDADVVALQEASLFRKQEPGDFASVGAESADTQVVDILAEVERALEARGLRYERAAVTTTSDAELPAETDDGPVDLRVTDRNALLVRAGVAVDNVVTNSYEADLALPVPGTDQEVALRRGYAQVDVATDEVEFTAVSTHLESVSSFLRVVQARELIDDLRGTNPVVLCGDLNSGPEYEPAAYQVLTERFTDSYDRVKPRSKGNTCCQSPDLRNDRSQLSRRIDAVLRRGALRATDARRVNHKRSDRLEVDGDDGRVSVWPSDHAGVLATFEAT